ncbi:MAG: invasion associated locus B family protein [Alphaproteobacteria bacterium]|nr:invasion associated locus B family protein [Alphaproteobacteria bacterium]
MKNERLIVGGVALLVGLLLGWMVRGVAGYNTHAAQVAVYDDWRVACPAAESKEGACELSTDIMDRTQTQPSTIARATITTDKDGKKIMGFILPYGVALEAGMGLRIGKDPVKVYQYRTCNTVGCIAQAPFDDAMAANLKNADDVAVMFAGLDGKPVTYPLSFKGYGKSYSSWKGEETRRKTWFWRLFS